MKECKGACIFCGQYTVLTDEEADLVEKEELPGAVVVADRIATMKCSCKEAREFQKKKKRSVNAKAKIEDVFHADLPEQLRARSECMEMLKGCIDLLIDGQISKVKVDMPLGIKASMSMSADGRIKIERSLTQKKKVSEGE